MTILSSSLNLGNSNLLGRAQTQDAELSDLELLNQVQAHRRRALEILYERYSAKALGLAFKILRDRDLAEQVVIDSFWRVWQRADQFQTGRGSFAAWFYGIVRHQSIDELRRRELRPVPSMDEQLEVALAADVTHENDVTEIVVRQLTADTVQNALQTLPPAQREVIWLAYFEGLTRQEISKQLGQPLGTIHTRARLGLDKLRALLTPLAT